MERPTHTRMIKKKKFENSRIKNMRKTSDFAHEAFFKGPKL
ncbi:Protein CBG26658 [Caenorhabditis briggsae]|uniref:Protein CBG26658 n=1 Tax=Caenorhabditis briggsae TaxID=6238 RepID=B6IE21_CAEBR|nr:Protein CBG26658 [Caenorhabditis briggsae]CAS01085.1 Protein CBG26658 [Caenorhabditis briggsae]